MYQIIGWVGAFFFILAYFLLSIKKLSANKVPYQLMNVLGAICVIINAIKLNDDPNLIANLVWLGIGLFAVFSILCSRA